MQCILTRFCEEYVFQVCCSVYLQCVVKCKCCRIHIGELLRLCIAWFIFRLWYVEGLQEILPRAGNEPYGSDFFCFTMKALDW